MITNLLRAKCGQEWSSPDKCEVIKAVEDIKNAAKVKTTTKPDSSFPVDCRRWVPTATIILPVTMVDYATIISETSPN